MARSLSKYGQLSPLVYCVLDDALVLVDGRCRYRHALKGVTVLQARRLETDGTGAKAAIFNLNRITSSTQ
ncbi:MAG: hypothetical protein R3C53_03540 [Pirellulaceae bacterium]